MLFPWPLSPELYRITPQGPELYEPDGPNAALLATLQKLDLAGLYKEQKEALEKYHAAIQDDVFIATYLLMTEKQHADDKAPEIQLAPVSQGMVAVCRPVSPFVAVEEQSLV